MFEQLTQLVQQYSGDTVVKNEAVPNEHNEAVITETSNSIFDGLKKIASEGGTEQLAALFNGSAPVNSSNPVVQKITEQLSGTLGNKFGISSETSSGVAASLIPQVLNSLVNKAKDPKDSSFQISDIISSITGNSGQASGIMDAISKYGTQFGLDQNNDGKIDEADVAAIAKKGGLGGLFGRLFSK
ncbi:DUF937 domain-containing protein [Flavobacterium hercynium]|uniref:EF-hand domain-containing protein n=1 Tax=Flavobacterium hercynium TaxID=387094 RepID=A0A226GY45_9FLAO|nr:hypothetical protein [Flavobacterium hercynium]OXA86351.1 hypothetical protein B0A66_17885 [Flavobacterium hercynium]SMP17854.1 hypothetical protein SAMN06265346_105184 [Flavobacterium hercynium]